MADKPYTQKEWLCEKYMEDGLNQKEIADICGVSQATISYHLKKNNIDTRNGGKWVGRETPDEPYTDEEWLRDQYHGKRKTTTEMGKECGVSSSTIQTWMEKLGIDRRDNSKSQIETPKKVHNEEWLREQYIKNNRSMRDIGDEVGMTPSGVKKWIDRFGIETRSSAEHYRYGPASFYTSSTNGYEYVTSKYDYERDGTTVHQLVAIADGANPSKVFSNGRYHVHHKNGVKWDNRPENLELRSSKTHAVHHHHDDKHGIPDEYATDSCKEEVLFELRGIINSWRDMDNSTMEMCADELDGALREL